MDPVGESGNPSGGSWESHLSLKTTNNPATATGSVRHSLLTCSMASEASTVHTLSTCPRDMSMGRQGRASILSTRKPSEKARRSASQ
eukprot:CAMPEP_0173172740 /NCGR_PEP_ID=MMETSP1141-20130122/2469_1 /TAXON_ID=483371 /ORGANISM="non described non described, Strain CCMP2298" /LENGTH=86 /DNA_ID=CAMNT_0014094795 /DNA_START=271 /DNA_END=531 /DNA_ORIENTATION=-